jgi:hypothetical protein
MKKILTLTFFVCAMVQAVAQTDGITYQAVIIGPDDLELPGVDAEGNYLPNTTIAIRFTIYDSGNQVEFEEVQVTETDDFGRINLLIGEAEHDYFKEISWDGTPKDLKVEIDFEAGSNFEEMSRERLTFLPFAYHRNITATGTLTVDDRTYLNGELEVHGPTNLFSSFTVYDNNSILGGDLTVDGETNLNGALTVNNTSPTNLTGTLNVDGLTNLNDDLDVLSGHTTLNTLTVNGEAAFGDLVAETLKVTDSTTLQGGLYVNTQSQVRVNRIFQDNFQLDTNINHHVMLIEGGRQGLAIKVNGGRDNTTNFITFFDDLSDQSWGRIEGERVEDFVNNADYQFGLETLEYDSYDAIFDTGVAAYEFAKSLGTIGIASTSSTGCVGFGACVTAPIPSWIIGSTAQSIVAGLQIVAAGVGIGITQGNLNYYQDYKAMLEGVTYASGAGDYAEYLLREDVNEKMVFGDIVGVKGGKITKNLLGADRMMVVSYKPIVLGNMPEPNRESEYEKVAFMGQVPVKVFGKVNIGDYIIPSGKNDGIGMAIKPEYISSRQLKNIVGVAWAESNDPMGMRLINTAVGVNRNDSQFIIQRLEDKVDQQAKEITYLKGQIESILDRINNVENGTYTRQIVENEKESHSKYEVIESPESDIIYHEITRDDFEKGLILAEQMILSSNKNGENEKLVEALNKLKTDEEFKTKFFNMIQEELSKQIHFHQEIDIKGRH